MGRAIVCDWIAVWFSFVIPELLNMALYWLNDELITFVLKLSVSKSRASKVSSWKHDNSLENSRVSLDDDLMVVA